MGPPRKMSNNCAFFDFFRPLEKMTEIAPNGYTGQGHAQLWNGQRGPDWAMEKLESAAERTAERAARRLNGTVLMRLCAPDTKRCSRAAE